LNLLYREKKFVDEALPDYLTRLAYWNGFRSLESFSKSLKKIYQELYVEKESGDTKKKNLIIHHSSIKDHFWIQCKYAIEYVLKRDICVNEVNISEKTQKGGLKTANFCSDCWKEAPYVRFYWRLGSYGVCHNHGSKMQQFDPLSYNPDVGRLRVSAEQTRCSLSSESDRINRFLLLKGGAGCSLMELLFELDNANAEHKLWSEVVSFLERRFRIRMAFNSVSGFIESNNLCSMDPLSRLDKMIDALVNESTADEKLVKISVLVSLERNYFYSRRVSGFSAWAMSLAYSLSPLFAAYLFGIGEALFDLERYSLNKKIGPISFSSYSDRKLCQFVIESRIFDDRYLREIYTGGKNYSTGWTGYSGPLEWERYVGFGDSLGEDIFDSQPLPRRALEL